MSLFTSNRERRLWLWTLAVLVAIYTTLGLAGTLAGILREHGLLAPVVFLCLILVAATILTQGMKTRPGGVEIAVALGIVATYLLMFARMVGPIEERTHLMEYGVVAIFMYEALKERASHGRHVPKPSLVAILATSLLGVLDECIQWFLPSRVFDPMDMLFNVLAALMSVAAGVVLGWVRRLTRRWS